MPIRSTRNDHCPEVHTILEGVITPEMIHAYFEEIVAGDPLAGARALIELRSTKMRGFDFRSVQAFAKVSEAAADAVSGARTAVVADGKLAYGLIRMYIAIRDPDYEFRLFEDVGAALAWLEGGEGSRAEPDESA